MPLTDTLKTASDLRGVGFSEAQANLLAQKLEETAHAQNQDLKAFLRAELGGLESRLETRMDAKFAEVDAKLARMEAKFEAGLRDQLFKLVAILVTVVSLAVAIIKVFPGAS